MLGLILTVWLATTSVTLFAEIVLGLVKIRRLASYGAGDATEPRALPLEVIVPVKGIVSDHELALRSLLEQDYPDYGLIFVSRPKKILLTQQWTGFANVMPLHAK